MRSNKVGAALLVFLLVAGSAGFVTASSPAPEPPVPVKFCTLFGGLPILVPSTTTKCANGKAPIEVSRTGPAGPAGATGAAGAVGPAGPAGVSGPAGSGLTSIEDLEGLPCSTSGTGRVRVSVTLDGPINLQCRMPTSVVNVTQAVPPGTFAPTKVDSFVRQNYLVPPGSFSVPTGSVDTLTLLDVDPELVFTGWGGACASAGRATTCSLTVDGDTSVTVSFALKATMRVVVVTPVRCRPATNCPSIQVGGGDTVAGGLPCGPTAAKVFSQGFSCLITAGAGQTASLSVVGEQFDFSAASWAAGGLCTVTSGATCTGPAAQIIADSRVFLDEPIQ